MRKGVAVLIFAGLLITLLVWSTPVTRLGSGFLIGDGRTVLTQAELVNGSGDIRVKFPNEDDIAAERVSVNNADRVAVLKLQEAPKVKREPLAIPAEPAALKENYVFALGYPWTNTLEDRHTLHEGRIESLAENASGQWEVKMELNPVHSGSPLFSADGTVVGMIATVMEGDAGAARAVPAAQWAALLKTLKIKGAGKRIGDYKNRQAFIEAVRNNVVLIEAR